MAEFSTSSLSPWSEVRSEGEYDLVGTNSRETMLCETIAEPVVPAGMFFVAMTADVVTGAWTADPPACLLAPCTLAYAMALPAMNRIAPMRTSMSVCFFTKHSPSHNRRTMCRDRHQFVAVGSVGGYDGKVLDVYRTF